MLVKKSELKNLSTQIRQAIDGEAVDFLDNREGIMSVLKNDIQTLVNIKEDEMMMVKKERDIFARSLADISHQLKTPLTSMLLMADLMESASLEKQREFNQNMKSSLVRMEWLVASLLKIAKLESHTIEFIPKEVQVESLLQSAKQPLDILLDIKNQRVRLSDNQSLTCDEKWTIEALTNIIKNASEHSPKGGVIVIHCGSNPLYDWISIKDSGQGISKDQYASLFRRYEYSASKSGYGIGLSLALAIMKGQGGDIEVDGGGHGQGATFTLKFYK